ncbi:MAG TPA: hypothetical protein VGT03_08610 [Candidatus Acidoferrales bacterium]|nr:hypothetical protein [Candidatus Acidoferrales bacterium]
MDKGSAYQNGPGRRTAEDRLESWKEIAQYLRREVRTIQRWEKRDGLPIHRLQHDKLGSVYAFKSELETWIAQRDPCLDQDETLQEEEKTSSPSEEETIRVESGDFLPRFRIASKIYLIAGLLSLAVLAAYLAWPHWLKLSLPSSNKIKLVVLPFRNLSGDPAQDSLASGLTEEMTTRLGRLDPGGLGVIASTTAEQVKEKSVAEIGTQLNVNYVLEGSVFRAGDQVRVDAQLIQVSDQTHRWADSYDRDMKDILALQSDIAESVAREIELTIKPEERERLAGSPSVDPEAYDAYLQGLSYWNTRTPEYLTKSVHYFQQAVDKDPKFAAAYAGLSSAYSLLSQSPTDMLSPREAIPKARAAAEEAVKIDPASAEGHVAMALVRESYDWDWKGAEREYQRAIEINPSYATARQWHYLLLMALGRRAEAFDEIQRAEEIDPLSVIIRSSYAQALFFDRQYDRVIQVCQKTIQVAPNFPYMHYHLGRSYAQKGMFPEAIAEFEKMKELTGGQPLAVAMLGNTCAASGQRNKALEALQELKKIARKRYVPAVYYVAIYTGLGDKDQAFSWLNKAVDEHDDYLINLRIEPMADPLRSDPRFGDVLRRIGLPQ